MTDSRGGYEPDPYGLEGTDARTELWYVWAEIAVETERAAVVARLDGLRALADGGNPEGSIEHEVKASMTCVVATAAVFDAMRNELRELLPDTRVGNSAAARFLGTLRALFDGVLTSRLESEVRWLFEQRNSTIHFQSSYEPLVRHPAYGRLTTHVGSVYTLELAVRAVDLLVAIFRGCTDPERAKVDSSRQWALRYWDLPSKLESNRARSS